MIKIIEIIIKVIASLLWVFIAAFAAIIGILLWNLDVIILSGDILDKIWT